MAMPRTATSSEEDEGAEERGPGIGGREGRRERHGLAGLSAGL